MRKIVLSFLLLSAGCIGCRNKDSHTKITFDSTKPSNTSSLNDALKKYEEPAQLFNVSSSMLSTVKGKKGTVIQIIPGDLEKADGGAINGDIQVELKELTN